MSENIIDDLKSSIHIVPNSSQLKYEIPVMIEQLEKHKYSNEFFESILNQIQMRWGHVMSAKFNSLITQFKISILKEREKEKDIIDYALSLNIIKNAEKQEMDDLVSDFSGMTDPLHSLSKRTKQLAISKQLAIYKKPISRKK